MGVGDRVQESDHITKVIRRDNNEKGEHEQRPAITHEPPPTVFTPQDTDDRKVREPAKQKAQPDLREPGDEPEAKEAPTFDSFQQRIMNAVNATAIKRVLAEAARAVPDWLDQQQLDQLSVLGQEVSGKL